MLGVWGADGVGGQLGGDRVPHTLWSIAFWHLAPYSCRVGYVTEWALLISAQLSTDGVSALRKVWVLITKINKTVEAT